MENSEIITNIVVLLVAVLAGLGGYLRKQKTDSDQAMQSAMTAFDQRDFDKFLSSIEHAVKAQERMAVALETMADKKAEERDDTLNDLVKQIASMNRPPPPRRR